MAKITELPKATSVNDTDIAVIVQDGETKQVPKSVFAPTVPIDTEMSETSENPVQNKVAKAYTDEKTKATPTDIALTDNLLQLTANGEAVGSGVTIPAPKETFVKTYFDYAKLKDVSIGNEKVFSIKDNLSDTYGNIIYIEFILVKDKLDESTGALVVKPVLTGLPSLTYEINANSEIDKYLDINEKVSLMLQFEADGEKYVFSEDDFKELFSTEKTNCQIIIDTSLDKVIAIDFQFSAGYEDIQTANNIKASFRDEIMPMFSGMHVAIDKVEWTEKESELVYVE